MIKTIYNSNKTMKILGQQHICEYITPDGVAYNDYQNVLSAHKHNGTYRVSDIAMDFFSLGLIYGKKLERSHGEIIKPLSTQKPLKDESIGAYLINPRWQDFVIQVIKADLTPGDIILLMEIVKKLKS